MGLRLRGTRESTLPVANIVAFLDADDRWLPDHLAVVTEILSLHPERRALHHLPAFPCGRPPAAERGGGRRRSARPVCRESRRPPFERRGPAGVDPRRRGLRRAPGGHAGLGHVDGGWPSSGHSPFFAGERSSTRQPVARSRSAATVEPSLASSPEARPPIAARHRPGRRSRPRSLERRAEPPTLMHSMRSVATTMATARTALGDACLCLPELSKEPQLVANRLSLVRFGPEGRSSFVQLSSEVVARPGRRYSPLPPNARAGARSTASPLVGGGQSSFAAGRLRRLRDSSWAIRACSPDSCDAGFRASCTAAGSRR